MKKIIISIVLFILLVGTVLMYYFLYRNKYITDVFKQYCQKNEGYQICYVQILEKVTISNYLTEKFNTSNHFIRKSMINSDNIPLIPVTINNVKSNYNNTRIAYQVRDTDYNIQNIKNIKQITIVFFSPKNQVIIDDNDILVVGNDFYITNEIKVRLLNHLLDTSGSITITINWVLNNNYEQTTKYNISELPLYELKKNIKINLLNSLPSNQM